MSKKATMVPIGKDGRMRVTVELCDQSMVALQQIMDFCNQSRPKRCGISEVIRKAVIHFERNGDWRTIR